MDLSPLEITSVLAGVVSVLLAYSIWRKQHKMCSFPDGPFSFPILGNLPQIAMSGSMGEFISKSTKKFGNVFTIEFGGSKRVVISGYQNIYNLMVKNADLSSNRSVQSFPQSFIEHLATAPGLIWAPFPHWKIIRSFSLNVMREEGMGKQTMEPKILDEIDRFCEYYIEPHCMEPIDLTEGLSKATCNVISELIFGGRNEYGDPRFSELVRAVDELAKSVLKAGILKNIPFAKYFKSSGVKGSNQSFDSLSQEMSKRLTRHRSDLDINDPRDIFDMFLVNQNSVGDMKSAFTDGNAVIMAQQLYAAGTETTSTAVRWALLYSCLNPDVKEKVCEEIRREIGEERPVSYKDRCNMPYTEAVLLETLRVANIAPNALPHKLERELEVDGRVIPAGADLMLNLASVLHDERVFDQPKNFKPERYLTGDVALKKQRTIPFGMGRRVCLGESLARMEFFVFYVTLLQRYDIKLSGKNQDVSTVPVSGLINHPQAYYIEFSKRY